MNIRRGPRSARARRFHKCSPRKSYRYDRNFWDYTCFYGDYTSSARRGAVCVIHPLSVLLRGVDFLFLPDNAREQYVQRGISDDVDEQDYVDIENL